MTNPVPRPQLLFSQIVLRSLDKDPDRRYQQATEVRMQGEALAGLIRPMMPSKIG